MTISGGRSEQLDILFCRVTGFTSDFLSFIVVEHIRFFHGALVIETFSGLTLMFAGNSKCDVLMNKFIHISAVFWDDNNTGILLLLKFLIFTQIRYSSSAVMAAACIFHKVRSIATS